MNDLYKAIDALNNIVNEAPPQGRQDGPGTRQGTTPKPKPAGPAAYNSIGDMIKAVTTPGRQGVADPNQSAKNIAAAQPKPAAKPTLGGTGVGRQDGPGLPKPAAPKINPAVPAATKAAASVVNAPKPATSMAMPKPKPAAPATRAKVKATAANTKDFDKTMALQKRLQAQGYDIKADGIMGKNTRAAMAKAAQSARPEPTGTARKVSTVVPGADAEPKAFTPIAGAGDRKSGPTRQDIRVDRSNKALARDFKKVKDAGGGILDKIGAGISSLFKPSERSVIGKKQAAAKASPAAVGPNAAGSNFATAADGSISRTDNPRQPGDAAPTTKTARDYGKFKASDGTNKIVKGDDGRLYVDQKVTDPKAKQALINKVNRARDLRRLQMAAGSTDPKVIRAYQNTMKNTKGMGAAGGTAPNTF